MSKKNKLRIFFYFLEEFRGKFFVFLLFSFILSFVQVLLISVLYPFVSAAVDQGGTAKAGFILETVKAVVGWMPVSDPVIGSSLLLIAMAVLQGIFRYLSVWSSTDLSSHVISSLQKRMYEKIITADLGYLLNKKQGDLIFKVKDPPVKIGQIVRGTSVFIREALISLFIILMMSSINVKLTIVVFLFSGLSAWGIKRFVQKNLYKTGAGVATALREEDVILNESLNGIYTIKAFRAEQRWLDRFADKVREFVHFRQETQVLKEIPLAILEALVIILIAAAAMIFKIMSPGSFVAFMPVFSVFAVSILKIIPSLRNMSNAGMDIVALFYNMELCYDVLHTPTAVIKNGSRGVDAFKSTIDFNHVDFSYPGHKETVFKNLSLSIRKDEVTALVGKSGSGKTTLINLLLRFYDPIQGQVVIDGLDLREIERTSWLEKIGYVSQDPFIFHATIDENIRFWNDYSRDEVIKAARLAGAHDFIVGFKDGYQAVVGDKGMKLSGGQKQRIAIARALLRNPDILIFDEATSALDAETERCVQKAIHDIAVSHTVIIIAHGFSMVKAAHKILVFEDGKLLEEGSHDQLLKHDGYYRKLCAMSFA